MEFLSYSAAGDSALEKFQSLSPSAERDPLKLLIHQKIASCPYKVSLIAADELLDDRVSAAVGIGAAGLDPHLLRLLWQAWRDVRRDRAGRGPQQAGWGRIDRIGTCLQPGGGPGRLLLLRRFLDRGPEPHFFVLLTGAETHGLPTYELSFLCSLCQLAQSRLPAHAAGVIHRGGLYLFAGVSGAGKSTAAALSARLGDAVLDDDQVLIELLPDGQFSARAWGYGTGAGAEPLQAIFFLFQDQAERLQVLSKASVARLLFARSLDIMGNELMDDDYRKALTLSARIARAVPGYELHFRPTPDFWTLIDETLAAPKIME